MHNHRANRARAITITMLALGIIIFVAGSLSDGQLDPGDIRSAGAVIILLTLCYGLVERLKKPSDVAYTLGHADGYREGYREGRSVAKPVVVRGRFTPAAESPLGADLRSAASRE